MKKQTYLMIAGGILILLAIYLGTKKYSTFSNMERVSPKKGEIVEAVYGLGKVKTNKLYQVKLGVISTVQAVFVKEGDSVLRGQKLISLDSGTTFKAPFNGVVTLVSVHEGETAGTQGAILAISDLNERFIELLLEQEGALRIKKDQIARVGFESMRGQTLIGKVSALYPREDEFVATISVDKLDQSILPGMSADVAIEVGKINGITVPAKSIRNGIVTVERSGKIQKIKVEVGLVDGLSAEIKNGSIQEDDLILISKDK